MQSFSEIFIRRPVGTTLLAVGLLLVGIVAYQFLPVASLPSIEFPTISVTASRPGADPETMAATVAAPLERRLGEIPGVTELTSRSSLGSTRISVQFDLSRSIDGAARDVQAAINAALTDLPSDLQSRPSFRKANPAATPVMILALTSKTVPPSALYDAADTVIAQRLSQVEGVAEVSVNGAEQPAIRVRVNPLALASMGLDMEAVRTAIANTNAAGALGVFDGPERSVTIGTNDQLRTAADYDPIVVRTSNGAVVRLSAIASIEPSVRNSRSAGWFNGQPSVLLVITKQADANVIETVDQIYRTLPDLKRWIPAGVDITVLSDRTGTIRGSIAELQLTLLATVCLVMLVVFVFLRRAAATVAAGVTVPLSLAGTCAAMWLAGFSINNLSLMALVVSVGFVVDDAIVMIENCFRNLEKGMSPLMAAVEGARQIGFTVLAISISLVAAFIPLLFMTGVVGRVFREFSVTLAFAVMVSTVVSLTVTPMICAHFVRKPPSLDATWFDRLVERVLGWMLRGYRRSLAVVLDFRGLTLLVMAATIVMTGILFVRTPKG
ncbi:MAG: efflux RND transporter permease subunit, partial [Pseudolabrys sp.]